MTSTAEGNEALFCFAEDRCLILFWRKSDFWFNEVPFALHPPASVKKILFCFFFNLFPKEVCLITVQALDNKSLSNAQRHTFKILIPRHQSYHELHSGREWSEKEKPSQLENSSLRVKTCLRTASERPPNGLRTASERPPNCLRAASEPISTRFCSQAAKTAVISATLDESQLS